MKSIEKQIIIIIHIYNLINQLLEISNYKKGSDSQSESPKRKSIKECRVMRKTTHRL